MDLWTQLDQVGRCSRCRPDNYYCAPYVGPDYQVSRRRIVFVGLDHGQKISFNATERRDKVINWWEEHGFRDHYKGCIWVASELLQTSCRLDCQKRCLKNTDCALRRFSQTNGVRCVDDRQGSMTFRNSSVIPACMLLVFDDIRLLRPHIIILQGRNRLEQPFLLEAERQGAKLENKLEGNGAAIADLIWNDQKIIVAALRHPSHSWLERDWKRTILPILGEIKSRSAEI